MSVAIGQFTIVDLNDITTSDTAPSNPTENMLWLDTSVTPNILKKYDGSAWTQTGASSLEQLDPTAQDDITTNTSNIINTASAIGFNIETQQLTDNGLNYRVKQVEVAASSDSIVSTVRNSSAYIDDLGEKITSDQAATIAQTASNIKIGFNGINDLVTIDEDGLHVKQGSIDGAVINGGTITGATLKTSSSANYMMVDAQSMGFYYNNTERIKIGYDSNYTASISLIDTTGNVQKKGLYMSADAYAYLCSDIEQLTASVHAKQAFYVDNGASTQLTGNLSVSGSSTFNYVSTFNESAIFNFGIDMKNTNISNVSQITATQFTGLGRTPAKTLTVTIGANNNATFTHNLGYYPIVKTSGTVGNCILTFSDADTNTLNIHNYSGGGASWSGTIYLY